MGEAVGVAVGIGVGIAVGAGLGVVNKYIYVNIGYTNITII